MRFRAGRLRCVAVVGLIAAIATVAVQRFLVWVAPGIEGRPVIYFSPSEIERLPRRYLNSVGIEMQLVTGGEYYMGSDQLWQFNARAVARFGPRHRVRLSPFYVARREVTIAQFEQYLKEQPEMDGAKIAAVLQREPFRAMLTPETAVTTAHWSEAAGYCEWLSEREGCAYRLPTEAEWEYFCRAGATSKYWWGDSWDIDAFRVSYRTQTSEAPFPGLPKPYGFYPQNQFGLYDILGNAYEWNSDWHDLDAITTYRNSPLDNPQGPRRGTRKVKRGGSVRATHDACDCVYRGVDIGDGAGFRVVREIGQSEVNDVERFSYAQPVTPLASPSRQTVPLQRRRLFLRGVSVSMDFVLLPEGEFELGSDEDEYRHFRTVDEGPRTPVRVRGGVWMGVTEVTESQLMALGVQPANADCDSELPVHGRDVHRLYAALEILNTIARLDGQLAASEVVRLPTETEWEYACRAGSSTAFSFGAKERYLCDFGWVDQAEGPYPVGTKLPNPWGIFDMHGNVWELCSNGPWAYPGTPIDSLAPPKWPQAPNCCRGGGWAFAQHRARSAARQFWVALEYVGIRLVISQR